MKGTEAGLSEWQKQGMAIAGLLLAIPGLAMVFSFFCLVPLLVLDDDEAAIGVGLVTFILGLITLGAGGVTFWHSLHSMQGKISKPLRLPPAWLLGGLFGLFVAMGLFISEGEFATGLFFPPILAIAAALPPLLAIAWFTHNASPELTWRRGMVAFAGGMTLSVLIALILEILFPALILVLVFELGGIVMDNLEALFEALAGENLARAITSPGFIYLFIQIAIIAPLAEELAKPLVTLPLLGRVNRKQAFLIGAMAGAGFAAMENILYASFGLYFWAGILVVRALGGAIHPLGSGLVALGWHGVLRGEAGAWSRWFMHFGLAAAVHALWNGGSLLVITLAGAQFFGELPPEIDILGLSTAGTTLALLVVLGLAALWLGRAVGQSTQMSGSAAGEPAEFSYILSNRAVAIWALACLVTIVPAGITGLQILIR